MTEKTSLLDRLWKTTHHKVCHYCDRDVFRYGRSVPEQPDDQATADHVVPRSDGGTDDLSNLVLACWTCNSRKGTTDYELFRMRIHAERSCGLSAITVIRALGSRTPGLLMTGRGAAVPRELLRWMDAVGHKVVEARDLVPDGMAIPAPRALSECPVDLAYRPVLPVDRCIA